MKATENFQRSSKFNSSAIQSPSPNRSSLQVDALKHSDSIIQRTALTPTEADLEVIDDNQEDKHRLDLMRIHNLEIKVENELGNSLD